MTMMGTGSKRHDLRTFSTDELKVMLTKAQRWGGNPYPRRWLEEELRERGATFAQGET